MGNGEWEMGNGKWEGMKDMKDEGARMKYEFAFMLI